MIEGATFGVGTNLSWDAYQRELYRRYAAGLERQRQQLVRRGLVSAAEARVFVDQRKALVVASRKRLSPFGKLYSEIIKPSRRLPTYEHLIRGKSSNEAVLSSIGRTRAVVNRVSVAASVAGRGAVVINIALSVVVVARARS